MSYYQYYQQQPQWGTSGYQVMAPPRPVYQPQPNWGGSQYFQAQLGNGYGGYDDLREDFSPIWRRRRRRGFFDNVWRGIKDVFSRGMDREEAMKWHRRVYGGTYPVDDLDAPQLGAAAGYEAIRHWSTYGSTYRGPLADDRFREKEALAGIAAGEAVKLLSYSRRQRSSHTRREAAEIAAATAERIFAEEFEDRDPYDAYESRPGLNRRRGSVSRRRSSSFGYSQARPIIASTTGGTYASAAVTGQSYIGGTQAGYVQAQPQYVTAGGQQVQYVQAGASYAQPQVYGQQQPQYVSATTGQPLQYATTGASYASTSPYGGGIQYATTGGQYAAGYAQPQYVQATGYAQPQYAQATGVPQVVYGGQPQQQYIAAPQGYTRARALSTGGGYVYR